MRTAYRIPELYCSPEVTPEQAAKNRELAEQFKANKRRGNFNKPLHPRPAKLGLFRVSQSTVLKWFRDGVLPAPVRIGSVPMVSADAIHAKLREFGLPVPGESTTVQ
jgi:hypothetical protein